MAPKAESAPRPLIPFVVAGLLFALARLPLLLGNGFPIVFNDTTGYWRIAESLLSGAWPDFTYRLPGYPLFLAVLEVFPSPAVGAVVVQNLATLAAGLFLVHACARFDSRFAWWSVAAVAAHFLASGGLQLDASILPGSLFGSSCMLLTGCLLLFLRDPRSATAFRVSLAACLVFAWRPAFFLLPVLLAAGVTPLLRRDLRSLLALLGPFALGLALLAGYNGLTNGVWQPNASAARSLHWGLSDLLVPDPALPDWVNEAIEKRNADVSPEDRAVVAESWNPLAVFRAHENNIYKPVMKYVPKGESLGGDDDLLWAVNTLAVKQNPGLYAKLFVVEAAAALAGVAGDGQLANQAPFYTKLLHDQFESTSGLVRSRPVLLRHYRHDPAPPKAEPGLPVRAYELAWRVKAFIFDNHLWPVLFLAAGLYGLGLVVRTRFKDPVAWAPLLLFLLPLGQVLQAGMILHVEYRYVFPFEFLVHLTPGFFWLWFTRLRTETKKAAP